MKAGKIVEGKQGDNNTTFTDLDDPIDYPSMGKIFSFPTIYTYGANKDGQSF